ncbi:MAG: protein kinase domain-containing protein [Pseudanabaenaceae cyanobacterium]
MSYCLNPDCDRPQNLEKATTCANCGSPLILRGRYRAVKVLGQGGFGKTFRAIDEDRLGATCVIKQFLPQLSGTEAINKAVELFNQEAIRLYELGEHSQIPTLMAYFNQDNRQYLVQEFIAGKTLLQELAEEGPFAEAKIWKVLTDILPVLQFVHDRHVIHRDIKPENIIRRQSDGLPVLIDFGVAKLLQSVTSPQAGGTTIGSPGYMAMELLTEGRACPATDLYGLGTTVFHLLTGTSPHQVFLKYGFSWLPQWQKFLRGPISDALIYVLNKLLKEEVSDRYSSAEEVLQDIKRLHRPAQPPAGGISDEEFIESFLQEVRVEAPAAVAEVPVGEGEDNNLDEILADFHAPETPFLSTQLDDDKLLSSLLEDITQVRGEWANNETTVVEEVDLATWPPLTDSPETWQVVKAFETHSTGISYLAAIPDSDLVVTAGVRRTAKIWDTQGGDLVRSLVLPNTCGTCGGTGQVQRQVRVLLVDTVQKSTCPDCAGFGESVPNGMRFRSAAYLPGTHTLALSTPKGIHLYDGESGRHRGLLEEEASDREVLGGDRRGRWLAGNGNHRVVQVWSLERMKLVWQLAGHQGKVLAVVFTPDGQGLLSSSVDKTIKLWKLRTGKLVRTLVGHSKAVGVLAISGDYLASGSFDTNIKLWHWQSGRLMRTLVGHNSEVTALAFGNGILASGDSQGKICLWHVRTGQLVAVWEGHSDRITGLALKNGEHCLISGSLDRLVRVWRPVA